MVSPRRFCGKPFLVFATCVVLQTHSQNSSTVVSPLLSIIKYVFGRCKVGEIGYTLLMYYCKILDRYTTVHQVCFQSRNESGGDLTKVCLSVSFPFDPYIERCLWGYCTECATNFYSLLNLLPFSYHYFYRQTIENKNQS